MELCNLRFQKIKISEEVTESAKRTLVNNLLEYLHTAKVLSYDFGEGQNYKNFFILTNLS